MNNNKPKRKIFVIGGSYGYANWMQGQIVKNPDDADLLLFTGGEDVNPALYGEKCGKFTSFTKRDEMEVWYFNNYPNIKKIGICRGHQLLTVLSGGKLIQHVENHCGSNHDCWVGYMPKSTDFGGTLEITTCHHQMAWPFNLKETDYTIIAHAYPTLSKVHLDGDNREIALPKNFVEPEIIYFRNTDSLGIQGHPEFNGCPEETIKYLQDLLDEYMDDTLKKDCILSSNEETDFIENPELIDEV